MKTEDFALFTTVVKYGSQSAAAKVLGIPVSKVSRHIAQLEQQLGTCLLERNTRPLSLTEAGMELMERSKKILAEVEALQLSVGQLQDRPEGIVTIAAPLDFINGTCSEALAAFYERYPGLKLKFLSYQSRQNPLDIRADLILFVSHDTPPDCSMVGHKLIKFKRSFVASPRYIAENLELCHPKQLVDYPCLLTPKGGLPGDIWLWTDNNKTHSIEVSGPLESESIELCISGAIHGRGIAWVPPLMCLNHLNSGRLQLLFDGRYATDVNVWILYSNHHYLPHRVRLVLDFFLQEFARLLQQQLEAISKPFC